MIYVYLLYFYLNVQYEKLVTSFTHTYFQINSIKLHFRWRLLIYYIL